MIFGIRQNDASLLTDFKLSKVKNSSSTGSTSAAAFAGTETTGSSSIEHSTFQLLNNQLHWYSPRVL